MGKLKKRKKNTFLVGAQRKEIALKPEQSIITVENKMTLKSDSTLAKTDDKTKQIKRYSLPLD